MTAPDVTESDRRAAWELLSLLGGTLPDDVRDSWIATGTVPWLTTHEYETVIDVGTFDEYALHLAAHRVAAREQCVRDMKAYLAVADFDCEDVIRWCDGVLDRRVAREGGDGA